LDPTHQNLVRPPADNPDVTQDDVDAREDARLLYAIAGGDERALAALYHRRGGLIFSFLMRMLSHEAEAQEALQDTFIRLWRRAKDFDAGRSSATAWLLLFARGLALDRLRARSRHVAKLSAYESEVAVLETGQYGGGRDGAAPDELAGRVPRRAGKAARGPKACAGAGFFPRVDTRGNFYHARRGVGHRQGAHPARSPRIAKNHEGLLWLNAQCQLTSWKITFSAGSHPPLAGALKRD
jgi:RNA polymerase sigma factor (sigma-70 family)